MNQTSDQLNQTKNSSADALTAHPRELMVEAVYQDGILKPIAPLNLLPGTPLKVRIASIQSGDNQNTTSKDPGRLQP